MEMNGNQKRGLEKGKHLGIVQYERAAPAGSTSSYRPIMYKSHLSTPCQIVNSSSTYTQVIHSLSGLPVRALLPELI